jgi:hypothetical protein
MVRIHEASDRALSPADFLEIVKTDFHIYGHLVMEAEIMVGLNDREILLAFR